jgi:hypothetical protein
MEVNFNIRLNPIVKQKVEINGPKFDTNNIYTQPKITPCIHPHDVARETEKTYINAI